MRGVLRRVCSGLAMLLLGLGAAETAALHAHPLDENDLAAHTIAWVERGPACGSTAHFDGGRLGMHPTCVDCVLGASPAAAWRRIPAAGELRPAEVGLAGALADTLIERSRRAAGARAPPAA